MTVNETWSRAELPAGILEKLKDANVFFSEDWYQYTLVRGETICYLYSDSYVLAIRVKAVFFLKGGIMDSEPFPLGERTDETEKDFLESCCRQVKKSKKIDWIQTEISSCFLTYPAGATVFGGGNFILDLQDCDEEGLFQKMHTKNRNMIRRGERENIEIRRSGEHLLEDYKALEDQVWARSKRAPRSLEHYQELIDKMPDTLSLAVAYNQEGVPEAGSIFLYTTAMGYYHHGASKDHPTPGAHNYLIWKQLLYLKEKGVKKINFVGYRRPSEVNPNIKAFGIQNFKQRFGGDVLEAYGFRVTVNKLHFKLYRLASVILYRETYKDLYDIRSEHYPEYNQK